MTAPVGADDVCQMRLAVEHAMHTAVDVIHGDRPRNAIAPLILPRMRKFRFRVVRLHVTIAGMRFAHVQGDELDAPAVAFKRGDGAPDRSSPSSVN